MVAVPETTAKLRHYGRKPELVRPKTTAYLVLSRQRAALPAPSESGP